MERLASTNMTKTEWHCMHTLKSASRYVSEREKQREREREREKERGREREKERGRERCV